MAVKRLVRRPVTQDRDADNGERKAPSKRGGQPRHRQEDDDDDVGEVSTEDSEIRGGWSAGQQVMNSTSSFAAAFIPEEKSQIIKFMEDQPYSNYTRHWIERSGPTGRTRRSYNCLGNWKKDCPLCEAGDKPQAVSAFNVALIGDDGVPTILSWDCGPKIFNVLKGYANDPKVAPLTKGFFLVSRTGKKGTVNHQITPVKAHSLEEDYEITPPTQRELDRLKLWGPDIVQPPKRSELEEVAEEIADEY